MISTDPSGEEFARERMQPNPEHFIRALSPALRQAAAIARALEGRVVNRPKSGEATQVKAALTIADTATQEALLVSLLEHFPGVSLAAEEDTPSVARFPAEADAQVVIDPIDGTLNAYLGGDGPYAVMIGLAIRGCYEAAMVALPREGLFFDAVRGHGARMARDTGPPTSVRVASEGRKVLVSHELPDAVVERLRARGYEIAHGSGGAVALGPLLPGVCGGLRLALTAPSISIRGRIGALIAQEAGATLRCETGDAFPSQLDAPARALAVAERSADLEALEAALAAAPADSA
jgi:fructose-1,6-bisphosphatase/inositol monophosphatase family enzyme